MPSRLAISDRGSAFVEFIGFTLLSQCLILFGTLQIAENLDKRVQLQLELYGNVDSGLDCSEHLVCLQASKENLIVRAVRLK